MQYVPDPSFAYTDLNTRPRSRHRPGTWPTRCREQLRWHWKCIATHDWRPGRSGSLGPCRERGRRARDSLFTET